jgi:hypothetical protein
MDWRKGGNSLVKAFGCRIAYSIYELIEGREVTYWGLYFDFEIAFFIQ